MANCKQCGQEYEAKRSTSHYCSPKCKQEFYRNRMTPVTVTPVTLRDAKPVTVTSPKRSPLDYEPQTNEEANKVLRGINYAQPAPPPTTPYPKPERRPKTTRLPTHKRGKDIKVFTDLPLDVQQTIDKLSVVDGKIDQTIKAKRIAIAIYYQNAIQAMTGVV